MEFFFSEKNILNMHTMILVSFPSGGYVDEPVDNQKIWQGYKYVYFIRYHTLTVINFMNGEGVC